MQPLNMFERLLVRLTEPVNSDAVIAGVVTWALVVLIAFVAGGPFVAVLVGSLSGFSTFAFVAATEARDHAQQHGPTP